MQKPPDLSGGFFCNQRSDQGDRDALAIARLYDQRRVQSFLVLLEGAGTRDVLAPAFVGQIFVVVHFLVRAVRVVNHLAPGDVIVLTLSDNQNLLACVEIDAAGVLDKVNEGLVSLRHLTPAALGIIAEDELVEVRTGVGFYGSIESCWNGPKIASAPCQIQVPLPTLYA